MGSGAETRRKTIWVYRLEPGMRDPVSAANSSGFAICDIYHTVATDLIVSIGQTGVQ